MASSVSLLNNYNGSLFTFANKDLLMQGLMMKQGTYDLNKSRLEQLRNQVGFLDVAKNSDQEYLNRRLSEAEDVIKYSVENGDLSNTYLVDQLSAKIEEVVDEPILNAVVSTATRKREESQWKEAMERNDGSYSDINYSVMSRNWNKYISDDRVGVKYSGGGGFTPFVDIDKMYASKEFNDYLKTSGLNAEYIVGSDGVGGFRAIDKYEGTVDPNRLKQAIQSYMGEGGRKQLQINSIYKYGYGDTPESVDALRNDYNSRISSYLDNANSRLEAINLQLSNTSINSQEREQYLEAKKNLEDEITLTQSKNFDSDIVGEDGFINEEKFKSTANNIYSSNKMDQLFNLTYMSPVWKSRDLDEVQSKAVEFQEQKRQFELGYGLRAQQLEINRGNLELGMAKAGFTRDELGNLVPVTPNLSDGSLNQANVMLGEGTPITEEEANNLDITKEIKSEYDRAIYGIYKSMKGDWTESSTAKLENILATKDFSIDDEFDLGNGRKLKVTEENMKHLQTLSDVARGQNSTVALLSNVLVKKIGFDDAGIVDWKKARVAKGAPNLYYVKSEDGKSYIPKSGKMPSAKQNNLNYLATKIDTKGWDALTDEEKMTANFYKTRIASADLGLSKEEDYLVNRAFNRRIGGNIQQLKNIITQINREDIDKQTKDYTPAIATTALLASAISPGARDMVMNKLVEDQKKLLNSENIDKLIFVNPGLVKDNSKEGYELSKETVIGYTRSLINRDKIVLTLPVTSKQAIKDQENILYNSVRVKLGQGNDFKGDIVLQRVIKNGKPTDEFAVELDKKDSKGVIKREKTTITLKEEDLMARGIQIGVPEKTSYDAGLGNFASTTNIVPSKNFTSPLLGSLKINSGSPQYYSDRVNQSLISWQAQIRKLTGDEQFNIYSLTQSQPKIFANPKVVVRPEGGEYYMTLDLGDDKFMPFGESLGENVSTDRITTLKKNGDDNILGGLRTYISHLTNIPLQ